MALRIHRAYLLMNRSPRHQNWSQLDCRHVNSASQRWQWATGRQSTLVESRACDTLVRELERLELLIRTSLQCLRSQPQHVPPTVRLLYGELVSLDEEFDGIACEEDQLVCSTQPIVLGEVELGRFAIRLGIDRLGSDSPYAVVALEPHPAASDSDTTHPHVHGERLCAGQGQKAIHAALTEGRLYDFYTIVDRILHTYADGAAYVELRNWYGVPCHDCAATSAPDDSYVCDACEESLCADCQVSCVRCGRSCCSGCSERCASCDDRYCGDCLASCAGCGQPQCDDCLNDTLCPACVEETSHEIEITSTAHAVPTVAREITL